MGTRLHLPLTVDLIHQDFRVVTIRNLQLHRKLSSCSSDDWVVILSDSDRIVFEHPPRSFNYSARAPIFCLPSVVVFGGTFVHADLRTIPVRHVRVTTAKRLDAQVLDEDDHAAPSADGKIKAAMWHTAQGWFFVSEMPFIVPHHLLAELAKHAYQHQHQRGDKGK